jgi:hypothetical protein
VELRVTPAEVAIWSLGRQPQLLATHPRATRRGSWQVDQTHWDGLPGSLQPPPPCTGDCQLAPEPAPQPGQLTLGELAGWAQLPAARVPVARRALATYDLVGGLP